MLTIPPPCPLPPYILRPAGLLLPLFLPQDVVNAPADLLGFFHFPFQRKIPPVERFPLGGQLGILRFPCLYRQGGLADHHKSKGRGASPLPLRPAPVPAPICAGSSYAFHEKRSRRLAGAQVRQSYLIFYKATARNNKIVL